MPLPTRVDKRSCYIPLHERCSLADAIDRGPLSVSGRPYRFGYGASDGYQAGGSYTSAIVKVDIETGTSKSFSDGRHIFGEPLFVARPQGDGEDDGVLLSVGSAKDSETAVIAVIDAKTMTVLASAEVPSSIPLGFHGSFVRKEGR